MELLHGLNYVGLGACALNWSVDSKMDVRLRRIMNIKKRENVIGMVMVGHLPDTLKVPVSRRKDIDDVIAIHKRIRRLVREEAGKLG